MMDEIIKYIKTKTDQYEVFYNKNSTLSAEVTNDKISFVSDGTAHGIGVRVFVDNKLGFAYISNLDNFKKCIDTAIKVAKVNKPDKDFKGFVTKNRSKKINTLNKDVANLTPEWIQSFNKEFVSKIKAVNKNMLLSTALFSKSVDEYRLINSEGLDLEDSSASNTIQGALILENKGRLESIEFEQGDKKLLSPDRGTNVAKRLQAMLNKKPLKTSEMQLILHPEALAAFLGETYTFSVNGENLIQKKSLWHNKLNKKVFDEKLTITDDALNPKLFASRSFDNEGTPSKTFKVIDKGEFKTGLYDNYYAKMIDLESTGNAYRKVLTPPKILPNNILITPGNTKDVIAEADKAIFVRYMLGTHTMNEATGDFSLGVMEGFYVENGEVKHPVKDTMIAGNFLDVMNNVETIGKEVKHSLAVSGGCYLPEILFKKIKVIGN